MIKISSTEFTKPSNTTGHRLTTGLALTLANAAAWAAEPPTAPNLVPSEDGAYVVDVQANLAWPRCVEGMQWNGKTCTGKPMLVDHSKALALANARKAADGAQWRVPRVIELQRLVDKTTSPSRLDPKLFPAAPSGWHWTSTAKVYADTAAVNQYNYGNIMQGRTDANTNHLTFLHGWAVNLETGEARGDVTKRSKLAVRLVRPMN